MREQIYNRLRNKAPLKLMSSKPHISRAKQKTHNRLKIPSSLKDEVEVRRYDWLIQIGGSNR